MPASALKERWLWILGGTVFGVAAGVATIRWNKRLQGTGASPLRRPSLWLVGGLGAVFATQLERATMNQLAVICGMVVGVLVGVAVAVTPNDFSP
jgi:hypothetical protein